MMKSDQLKYLTRFAIIPILLSVLAVNTKAADVRAALSAKEAYVGSPITLRVQVSNADAEERPKIESIDGVDVTPLGTPSRSSQISIVNGRRSERNSLTYAWQLMPRRTGIFTIPPVSVVIDGQKHLTRPLRFSAAKSETGDLLLAEISGSEEEIYVGQPMKLTLRIWLRPYSDSDLDLTLSEGNMWQMVSSEKSNWGMFSERIAELVENRQRLSGEEVLRADAAGVEHRYYLYEIDATVYPKRPGKIDAEDVQIVVDYPTQLGKIRDPFDSFFDRGFGSPFGDSMPSLFGPRLAVTDARPIAASAEVNATEVLPIPSAGRPADYRGAVGHYKILTQASPLKTKAGNPITLHIGIQGDGPMDLVQAPPLAQLSELTRDFKVSDEPLAGIVQEDVKLFTTSIRPRREGISHIPAIPFSYFDPDKKQFVTIKSNPIAITVGAPDPLALDAIVGRAAGASDSSDGERGESTLQLTNFTGKEALQPASSMPTLWMMALGILPPLLFLTAAAVRYRNRLSGAFAASSRNDLKAALTQLSEASIPREIATLLHDFIADRNVKTVRSQRGASEIDQARFALHQDTAGQLQAILNKCDEVSYGGQECVDIAELKSSAARCLQRVAAEMPVDNNHNSLFSSAMRYVNSVSGKAAKAASLAGFCSAMLFCCSGAYAAGLTPAQSAQILEEASTAYERAQQTAATDSAESKQAFSRAAQKYQTLIDAGISNDLLFFNLGNAYLQSGSLGLAIANYQRALALNPASPARDNLAHTRELLNPAMSDKDSAANQGITNAVLQWNATIPPAVAWSLALLGWGALWAIAAVVLFRPGTRLGKLAIPAGMMATIAIGSLVMQSYAVPTQDRVVVIAPEVHLREGNGAAFAELSAVVHEGVSYDLLEQRGNWLKIAADGASGWINKRNAALVPAHPTVAEKSASPNAERADS